MSVTFSPMLTSCISLQLNTFLIVPDFTIQCPMISLYLCSTLNLPPYDTFSLHVYHPQHYKMTTGIVTFLQDLMFSYSFSNNLLLNFSCKLTVDIQSLYSFVTPHKFNIYISLLHSMKLTKQVSYHLVFVFVKYLHVYIHVNYLAQRTPNFFYHGLLSPNLRAVLIRLTYDQRHSNQDYPILIFIMY